MNTYPTLLHLCCIGLLMSCQPQSSDVQEKSKEAITAIDEKAESNFKKQADTTQLIGKRICRAAVGPEDEGHFEMELQMDGSLKVSGQAGAWAAKTGKWELLKDTMNILLKFYPADIPKKQWAVGEEKMVTFQILKQDLQNSQSNCLDLHVSLTELY